MYVYRLTNRSDGLKKKKDAYEFNNETLSK